MVDVGRKSDGEPVLSIRDLVTEFTVEEETVQAVDGVSYDVWPGEVLGVVGESGSGKSVTVQSILGLILQPPGRIAAGEAWFQGQDLLRASRRQLRAIRGSDIAMIFQDPTTSLNPVLSIGHQIAETLRAHNTEMSGKHARSRAVELLSMVGVAHAESRIDQYPHEYSGGMAQRAMIAMAIANQPTLLIADEPTTALDVTIQAQVLDVLKTAKQETNAATILITHDLGLIAEMADRVVVMYAGKIVEVGDVFTTFHKPRHPYTLGLMASLPRLDVDTERLSPIPGQPPSLIDPPGGCRFHPRCPVSRGRERCRQEEPELLATDGKQRSRCHFFDEVPAEAARLEVTGGQRRRPVTIRQETAAAGELGELHTRASKGQEILRLDEVTKHFPIRSGKLRRTTGQVQAVDRVSFSLAAGETVGLVGESGCGKSTVARLIVRLLDPTWGRVWFKGRDIAGYQGRQVRELRREIQLVFQDPFASLNPRMTVRDIIAEPLRIHGVFEGKVRRERVAELLSLVGLSPEHGGRSPHEFSGGQRQRIGIARALALNPQLLILDEPVSALDMSIQAQIVNLLDELQDELGLAYLFIAHDLSVVRHICDRVAVMYLGRLVEIGDRRDIYARPTHPYTQALLSAVPISDPAHRGTRERVVLQGDVPNPAGPPSGCQFRTRCFKGDERCVVEDPRLVDRFGHGHPSACHYASPRQVL